MFTRHQLPVQAKKLPQENKKKDIEIKRRQPIQKDQLMKRSRHFTVCGDGGAEEKVDVSTFQSTPGK